MAGARLSPVGRGMVMGLLGGLFLGGVGLLGFGARNLWVGPDCEHLAPAECGLEREIALTLGRQQVMFGAALALLALSLYLLYRGKLSSGDATAERSES